MMDYRENAGYIITDSCHVGDSEFVLGVHLTAPQQFVTWKCSNRTDYDWGHYFSDLFSAQKDLVARAQEEVQCLEEQRQNTIAPEAPPYSPWGKVQECETLCPGVYSVSTPGHGGVMVRRELAEKVFRKEAMGCGFIASGYLCFEEDNDAQVALREKNGLLCTRDSMTRFCYQNPEAEFEGNYCAEYGFKVQTPQHTYMLRCNPNYGDYNFYLYAYVSRFLEHHMEKAKQGIRFITPGYKELFRIPDGDHIRIFTGGGETRDRTCRVIDETHFETSGGYSSALYHICEFAERLEQTHGSVIPLRSSLPVQCFSVLPSSGELILLTRGEKGYSPCYDFSTPDAQQNREFADDRNVKNGVTKAQEAAMLAGSMLGWQTPAADPRNYDEQGQPIKPRQKDRGEAR